MGVKRTKVVIIGAGMAGITAAHKLYTTENSRDLFDLTVVEGGTRIGGRINTSEFCGDRIETGATWIHGIIGSPIHKIALETNSFQPDRPWECMNGFSSEKMLQPTTIAEGGLVLNPTVVETICSFFSNLMQTAQENDEQKCVKQLSLGGFLRQGLDSYWESTKRQNEEVRSNWRQKDLEEALFTMQENIQRTYTGAGDLFNLDFAAEKEYTMFPGDEVTIPRGYSSVIESLASVLPNGMIQLGKRVVKIDWLEKRLEKNSSPVTLHFSDGSVIEADHVILTMSLGVLKAGVCEGGSNLFSPPLPSFKRVAIEKLGYGVVNKLFLELSPERQQQKEETNSNFNKGLFPFMQMVFHKPDSEYKSKKIPWWMRRTASLYPVYENSRVILSWFAGKEALELESLDDKVIIDGVSTTAMSFLSRSKNLEGNHSYCNGKSDPDSFSSGFKFTRIVKSKWGSDPLFLGSYSYVAVGSSGDDLDTMAVPLPSEIDGVDGGGEFPPLQLLFAGEATHRTHYSTTHGAYYSGLREANRLLKHYNCNKGW